MGYHEWVAYRLTAFFRLRDPVDLETRRKKQQALMIQLVERKVRSRAQQLYDERGREDGHALKDWFQAESEVVGNSILGSLYRKLKNDSAGLEEDRNSQLPQPDSAFQSPA
jgi:hypothetical protein